jgi:hypothetical protein
MAQFRLFALNSMKIPDTENNTSLTTETEALFTPGHFRRPARPKTLQPSVAAPLSFHRKLD